MFGCSRCSRIHDRDDGLRYPLDDVAVYVHLPAVVQAAQAAVFIAAKHQRYAAVRAVLVHHANAAIGIPEHHQLFTKNLRLDGCAVRLADLFD